MNSVKGTTSNEIAMIKAIQAAIGSKQDGAIGAQTMSDIAVKLGAKCFPLTVQLYGMPVIIANDLVIKASPGKGVSSYANSMNGSFYLMERSGRGVPISICISDGQVFRTHACHASEGYPESVLYRLKDGRFGIARVKQTSELPPNISWAVGGLGLLGNHNPAAEGFVGKFSDVLRQTNHSMLGVKNGKVYMVYCANMSGTQINTFASTLGLEMAIQLDGGHIAAINGSESFAKINTSIVQYYLLQGV